MEIGFAPVDDPNRYIEIDAVLVNEFDDINLQPPQRLLGRLTDALGPAIGGA
jgi:hypothetical protein